MNIEEKRNQKKKEILEKVIPLVDEEGLVNVSVKDICEKANLSTGSFYHYFESKDAIVDELILQTDLFFRDREIVIRDGFDSILKLERFALTYMEMVRKHGYYVNRMLVMEMLHRHIQPAKNSNFLRILEEIIEEGFAYNEFREGYTNDEIKKMMLVLLNGYAYAYAIKNQQEHLDELFTKQVHVLAGALRVDRYKQMRNIL